MNDTCFSDKNLNDFSARVWNPGAVSWVGVRQNLVTAAKEKMMGQLDTEYMDDSYETRELAWELQQHRPDQQRIRIFLEQEADLRRALRLANLQEKDLTRHPMLKSLHLEKHLQ
jgi:hypothetical protein